jgi:hypothetical protein
VQLSDIDATVHTPLRPDPVKFYLHITAVNGAKLLTSLQENMQTIFGVNKPTYRIFESIQGLAMRG